MEIRDLEFGHESAASCIQGDYDNRLTSTAFALDDKLLALVSDRGLRSNRQHSINT